MRGLKKQISFDVEGKPPKKSQWGKDGADLVIKLRDAALDARKNAGIHHCYHGHVKLSLVVYAPNISHVHYRQTSDDDPKKFIGDLDSLVSGVCEYLQRAEPEDETFNLSPLFNEKPEIGPKVPLIIKEDSQIVEIIAKKIPNEIPHYHVEIEYL